MKEKIQKFLKSENIALLALFILEIGLMIFITPNRYDDQVFLESVTGKSVWSYVGPRYYNWSSRLIIEFVLCSVLKISKYLWILIEALMVTLAGYSIAKLFVKNNENKKENFIMLVSMILIYPIMQMNSAGWAATTINYMWPMATGLFSLIPIRKIWDGEKIKFWQYPLYVFALLFAGNQEQSCAILFGTYLLFTVLIILKNKKIHPFIIVQDLLIIASLIFILTCPGNNIRTQTEIANQFKDFEMLTILDKIGVGLTATMGLIIDKGNIVFAIMSLIISVYIFMNYKEKLYRVISLVPVFSIFGLCYFRTNINAMFPFFGSLKTLLIEEQVMLTAANCNNLLNVIPIIFAAANFICLIMSLLLIFKNLKNNVAILVFLIGLASRLIMGFSPIVFLSGERTMLFFDFSMIIVSIIVWQELIKKNDKNDKKIQKRMEFIVKATAVLQYINCLVCILATQK
ncbi:MAG: hypothetical protein IKL55_05785 [Clostridia bacterium]|nr:hypothetical protein [Clostridia bacterium]